MHDGVNDLVTVADASSLDLTTAMTIEAWVYPTTTGGAWRTAVLKERGSGLSYALYSNNDSKRAAGVINAGGDKYANAPSALPANMWSHVAVTYDGGVLQLFLNGTQVSSRAVTGSIATGSGPLRFGGNAVWGEYFKGRIDESASTTACSQRARSPRTWRARSRASR